MFVFLIPGLLATMLFAEMFKHCFNKKKKGSHDLTQLPVSEVAGAGLEPTTFGL